MARLSLNSHPWTIACIRTSIAVLVGLALSGARPDRAQAQQGSAKPAEATTTAIKNDYSNGDAWLCRPGRKDSCTVDLATTVIAVDGKLTREEFTANPNAPIDCFYVYPTVSAEPTDISDMKLTAAEQEVVRTQLARFGSQCLLYAPLYRQLTLAGLRKSMAGGGLGLSWNKSVGYRDIVDAWHYYLEHDNHGRGVVLIGHSQGSFLLMPLIRSEIDGEPVQSHVISALLLGAPLAVPQGKDVGGVFQHMPLCHSTEQVSCVIAYSSFRASSPPPPNSLFGRAGASGMMAACVNPSALGGGSGALDSYFRSTSLPQGETQWVKQQQPITTPFVSVQGMLTAQCVADEHWSYLAITVHADPDGRRVSEIPGDVVVGGEVRREWGLHLVDVDLSIGNLVDIVGQQSKAWLAGLAKK